MRRTVFMVGPFGLAAGPRPRELLTHSHCCAYAHQVIHLSRTLQYENPFSGEAGLGISTGPCAFAEKSTEFWGRFLRGSRGASSEFGGRSSIYPVYPVVDTSRLQVFL